MFIKDAQQKKKKVLPTVDCEINSLQVSYYMN